MKDEFIIKEIEKRLKTLMIGSIARFENSFGYLWNHDEEPETENQKLFLEKWENLRNDLLNHGNGQIRIALDQLSNFLHNKSRYRYNYNFSLNNDNKRS
jgi:hypothetical protein